MEQRATFSGTRCSRDGEGVGGTFGIEKERGFKVIRCETNCESVNKKKVFDDEILVES